MPSRLDPNDAVGRNAKGEPYNLTEFVLHEESQVIPYSQQVKRLTSKGFALWDIIKECKRKGSLDQDIKEDIPNDLRGFCQANPSVKRIVIANGGTGCDKLNKHFKDWWLSGELKPGQNPESQKAFQKYAKHTGNFTDASIEVISALPVSPAAAKYTYKEKRDFWETFVYTPGLQYYEESLQQR